MHSNIMFSLIGLIILVVTIVIVFYLMDSDETATPTNPNINTSTVTNFSHNDKKPSKQKTSPSTKLENDPYTPSQLTSVYKSSSISLNGTGQKIAIISAFKYDNIEKDFKVFCSKYNFSKNTLKVHNLGQKKNTKQNDWSVESCLDTQWSRVMAPNADIIIVNAESNSIYDMTRALRETINIHKPNIISMSWGSGENSYIANEMEGLFKQAESNGITCLAASGDWFDVSYPSSSASVVSVGGTRLYVTESGEKKGETDWALPDGWGTGHGLSKLFTKPGYQTLANSSNMRSTPDISCMGASPSGNGVSVYNNGRWLGVHGTSLSCPMLAGMVATVNSTRATMSKKTLSKNEILSNLYNLRPSSANIWPVDTMADGVGYINDKFIEHLVSL